MKYRKITTVVVDAIQWNGYNIDELKEFVGDALIVEKKRYSLTWNDKMFSTISALYIKTLEGDMKVGMYDYIIKGICGEFYPCKRNIFDATYEEVEDK